MFLRWNVNVFFLSYSTYLMQIRNRRESLTTNAAFFFVPICFLLLSSRLRDQVNRAHSNWLSHDARFQWMRSCEIYDFEYVPYLLCIIFCTIYKSRFDFLCSVFKFSWQYFLTTRCKSKLSYPICLFGSSDHEMRHRHGFIEILNY